VIYQIKPHFLFLSQFFVLGEMKGKKPTLNHFDVSGTTYAPEGKV
jgi:20S proteasome alpha/beta subunit